MILESLREMAGKLPLLPGVYLMKDASGAVIYVGKAKKLKNRVSQYFQDTASHTPKTRIMVSKIHHFDVIVASSEFEALVLECSLIKQHMPKYNILLKDDKGYPYIRLDMRTKYPSFSVVGNVADDGAEYFGPFGSRGVTKSIVDAVLTALKLPKCSKRLPGEIGKGRACLNFHMNQCAGWCSGKQTEEDYRSAVELARQIFAGNYKQVASQLCKQMLDASEELNFELAARIRDQLQAVENLSKKQFVTAGNMADTDAIGFAQNEQKACYTVLHYCEGNLMDKEYQMTSAVDDSVSAVESLLKQYYLNSGYIPRLILVPFELEDSALIEQLLTQKQGRCVEIRAPKRGDGVRLMQMAVNNAQEEMNRITTAEENRATVLKLLARMLCTPVPKRIESFDISNISGTDIVASMVVFSDGKPLKSAYKHFKVDGLTNQDDYESMRQVVTRRFQRYLSGDMGFSELPDLLLIDGGANHAAVAMQVLDALSISVPVFGMVKDHRHRTRALVTGGNQQVNIDAEQSVYSLIGNIQEETHRFAITYHRKLRSKRLHNSELDHIPGVGPKRKQDLIRYFRSMTAIRNASTEALAQCLPKSVAMQVFRHFHGKEE